MLSEKDIRFAERYGRAPQERRKTDAERRSEIRLFLDQLGLRRTGDHEPHHPRRDLRDG